MIFHNDPSFCAYGMHIDEFNSNTCTLILYFLLGEILKIVKCSMPLLPPNLSSVALIIVLPVSTIPFWLVHNLLLIMVTNNSCDFVSMKLFPSKNPWINSSSRSCRKNVPSSLVRLIGFGSSSPKISTNCRDFWILCCSITPFSLVLSSFPVPSITFFLLTMCSYSHASTFVVMYGLLHHTRCSTLFVYCITNTST